MSKRKQHLVRHATNLPPRIKRWGQMLLEQQMWCWGCDVRRSGGNLLTAYGFKKRSSPEPRFHSAYTYWLDADCALTVWGWGLWIAGQAHGSLFINRTFSCIRYTPEAELMPQAWQERDLRIQDTVMNSGSITKSITLMHTALRTVGDYEAWLTTQVEADYREKVISTWPLRRRYRGGIPFHEMASQWNDLALNIYQEKMGQ